MHKPTVAEYTLQRLAALGIDQVFGVPGDYAFSVDDAVEKVDGLGWVACANELNAAYAADGYARIRGAAILSTTYGVGELSALNGVMGSKAHRVPIFHIVGMPSERIQHLRLITHHNLGDTRYDRFQDISASACCVSAVLTPDNCIDELERVIRETLRQSMPAYIVISEVNGLMPVIGMPVEGAPLETIKRQRSDETELAAAVAAITAKVAAAQHPVASITTLTSRYGVADKAAEYVGKANLPIAITPNDKGAIDESLPQFIGLYAAQSSRPAEVRDVVTQADLILDIGGLLLTELNTGLWGDVLNTSGAICIHDNWVRSGTDVYLNVAIEDVLDALLATATPRTREPDPTPKTLEMVGSGDDPTTSAGFYPRLQRRLRSGDTLVIETGTCMVHLNGMRLPAGVGAEGQGLWGSIGWATPAALGVALAKRSGRTWLVTGDGSHQLTLNELAVMGRYGVNPVIFVLNNGIFGIEDVISERGHAYDDLAPVQYHLLPAAFGCKDWLSAKVTTIAELDAILDTIESHDGAAYIELMIPEAESQPLPTEVIDRGYKLQTPIHG
ncbi:indolepyruvate decarboxylase [Mycolicibacterium cyprinidarum]|uniref:Alpha-keto-acid decarboxylase n=1 Tax=Mycolicibacterium cyprinidarum TaxID=2860311 RepID=A0ABQ4VC21_9MYCO|nr:indolepyruvate decarboxylase [Mycolicibacterium sp. NGTWSNA01]GJF16123.1 indolepyruvate decarboxylase [Mycolicibacterium sp. NGTWS0302]